MVSRHIHISIYKTGIILTAIILGFASCNKESDSRSDQIELGDGHSMYVDQTEHTIEGTYNNFEEILLDVDQDDSAELRLVTAIYGSPGMGIQYLSEIHPLDSTVWLYGVFSADTTFIYKQISIHQDEYNTYKSITNYYNCLKTDPSAQVVSIQSEFHPLALDDGDILSLSDFFAPDAESFIYQWSGPQYSYVENDTVILESNISQYYCHSLPYGEEIYLGFKLTGPVERLGWIKLILFNEAKITLEEFAIQKL